MIIKKTEAEIKALLNAIEDHVSNNTADFKVKFEALANIVKEEPLAPVIYSESEMKLHEILIEIGDNGASTMARCLKEILLVLGHKTPVLPSSQKKKPMKKQAPVVDLEDAVMLVCMTNKEYPSGTVVLYNDEDFITFAGDAYGSEYDDLTPSSFDCPFIPANEDQIKTFFEKATTVALLQEGVNHRFTRIEL